MRDRSTNLWVVCWRVPGSNCLVMRRWNACKMALSNLIASTIINHFHFSKCPWILNFENNRAKFGMALFCRQHVAQKQASEVKWRWWLDLVAQDRNAAGKTACLFQPRLRSCACCQAKCSEKHCWSPKVGDFRLPIDSSKEMCLGKMCTNHGSQNPLQEFFEGNSLVASLCVLVWRSGFLFPSATKSWGGQRHNRAPPCCPNVFFSLASSLLCYLCCHREVGESFYGVGMAGKAVVSLDIDRKGVHLNRLSSSWSKRRCLVCPSTVCNIRVTQAALITCSLAWLVQNFLAHNNTIIPSKVTTSEDTDDRESQNENIKVACISHLEWCIFSK